MCPAHSPSGFTGKVVEFFCEMSLSKMFSVGVFLQVTEQQKGERERCGREKEGRKRRRMRTRMRKGGRERWAEGK